MTRPTLLVPLLTLAICVAAHGADDDEAAARRAAAAKEERDAARQVRDADAGVAGDYFRLGPFITDDLALLKKATEVEATLHEKIAAAIERGDDGEVKRLRAEQAKATRDRMAYRERITEYRSRQFTAAPSERWFQENSRWSQSGIEELKAWGEARKLAAEAWGEVAEACKPGYDHDALEALKEKAYALDVEREIAEMRFNWRRERDQVLLSDKRVSSAEVNRRVEALKKLQEQRIELRRAQGRQERDERRLDRAIRVANAEFQKAFQAAQREAEERGRATGRRSKET
jgi:hypothetical protein